MGRTTDAIVATLLNLRVQLKGQSQQGACLAKVEPRAPRHECRRVATADIAEKIRFHMSLREKLLLAGLTFASMGASRCCLRHFETGGESRH